MSLNNAELLAGAIGLSSAQDLATTMETPPNNTDDPPHPLILTIAKRSNPFPSELFRYMQFVSSKYRRRVATPLSEGGTTTPESESESDGGSLTPLTDYPEHSGPEATMETERKLCQRCGKTYTMDQFMSNRGSKELKICLKCREVSRKSHKKRRDREAAERKASDAAAKKRRVEEEASLAVLVPALAPALGLPQPAPAEPVSSLQTFPDAEETSPGRMLTDYLTKFIEDQACTAAPATGYPEIPPSELGSKMTSPTKYSRPAIHPSLIGPAPPTLMDIHDTTHEALLAKFRSKPKSNDQTRSNDYNGVSQGVMANIGCAYPEIQRIPLECMAVNAEKAMVGSAAEGNRSATTAEQASGAQAHTGQASAGQTSAGQAPGGEDPAGKDDPGQQAEESFEKKARKMIMCTFTNYGVTRRKLN
ncbi:hypothetical protein BDV12DRAFT_191852 [Aspergillus spectabilis]